MIYNVTKKNHKTLREGGISRAKTLLINLLIQKERSSEAFALFLSSHESRQSSSVFCVNAKGYHEQQYMSLVKLKHLLHDLCCFFVCLFAWLIKFRFVEISN